MDALSAKIDLLKSNTETNERIDLVNSKLDDIADMKVKQNDHEDKISFLEMDNKMLRNDIDKLK